MSGILLISHFALWVLVLFLSVAVLTLARQIGLIHQRIKGTGAMTTAEGPEIGATVEAVTAETIDGKFFTIAPTTGKYTMVTVISPVCEACLDLVPALRTLARVHRGSLDVVIVSIAGDVQLNQEFITSNKLHGVPYVLSPQVAKEYKVASPPFTILFDETGIVRAKGVANHLEHLESLITAADTGHATFERFKAANNLSEVPEGRLSTTK